jgi:arginine utilization protein RocB
LINSECCFPKAPGDDEKKVYLGTCGKVMPVFFCVGKETHACTPFEGLNPNLIISHINSLMELNTDLCDAVGNDVTPPPTCLKQTDLKDLYSVQTPLYAAAYYNCISLEMNGNKVLEKLKSVAAKAFNDSIDEVKINYEKSRKLNNTTLERQTLEIEPYVISFSELYKCVSEKIGYEFESEMEYLVKVWMKEGFDNQTIGIKLIKETYERYQNKRPMVIVGFIPPFYPDKILNTDSEKDLKLYRAVENTIELAKEKYNVEIKKENYFMGICDLSYTGFKDNRAEKIHSNMASRSNYVLPYESLMKLDIPSIVFGGWGKDFHKVTERLNKSYSLKVVPDLYINLIHKILK